jgi:hypothetical protein
MSNPTFEAQLRELAIAFDRAHGVNDDYEYHGGALYAFWLDQQGRVDEYLQLCPSDYSHPWWLRLPEDPHV